MTIGDKIPEWIRGTAYAAGAVVLVLSGWVVRDVIMGPTDARRGDDGSFKFMPAAAPMGAGGLWRVEESSGKAWFVHMEDVRARDGSAYKLPVWYQVREPDEKAELGAVPVH